MNDKCFCHIGFADGSKYQVKDAEAREKIENLEVITDDLKSSSVEFIFNPQAKIDDSNYVKTTDSTPNASKSYFIKQDEEYVIVGKIASFQSGVTYYEKSSTYDNVQGECSVIKYKDKVIMVDTGGENRKNEIKKFLQKNGINKVDYLIFSHYHYDHCTNFLNMSDYIDFSNCTCYLPLPAPGLEGEQYNLTIDNKINSLGLNKIYPNEGDVLTIDDLKITFFNCGQTAYNELEIAGSGSFKVNDYSMMCLFTYMNNNVLYSGDIELVAQKRIYTKKFFENIKIDLYKWHHHGLNAITDSHLPYIKQISPIESVIMCQDIFSCNNDIQLHNLNKDNYAYDHQVKYISNGYSLDKEKENNPTEISEFKNIAVITNSGTPVNSYREFMKVKILRQWNNINLLFHASDINGARFRGMFSVDLYYGDGPNDVKVRVNNHSCNGEFGGKPFNIVNDIYIGQDAEYFHFYIKKSVDYISTTISLIDISGFTSSYRLYPSSELLNQNEFTSKYGDKFYNQTEWIDLDINETYVQIYNTQSVAKYRKVGNIVEIEATLKNVQAFSSQLIATIPAEYRPLNQKDIICQASGSYRFDLTITPSGNVTINRYSGANGTGEIPVNSWLKINAIYTV